MHQQWHWGENATWRRSQGGLILSCDGQWKAHKFQDDDCQTDLGLLGMPPPLPPAPLPPSLPPPLPLPPPFFPPAPFPRPLRDADGGWRCGSLCASLFSFASFHFKPIPYEQLGSLLHSSKLSAGLPGRLSAPLEFYSIYLYVLLQMSQPVLLLPP